MIYFQDFFFSGERMYVIYNQTALEEQIMAVSYVVQNLTAPVKRLHIRLKPNNDIVVNMYGFNNAATDKVVSNCGRKPIIVEAEVFALSDLQVGGVPITSPYNYYDSPRTQTWSLENHNLQPVNKHITVQWVEPPRLPLVGPDLYAGIYKLITGQSLAKWVDNIADAGMNYLRLIIPANCWSKSSVVTQDQSLFLLHVNGYNLEECYQTVLNKMLAGLSRARDQRRLTVQIDLTDSVMFRNSWFQYGEYAGANNTLGYPTSDFENSYYDSLAGGGSTSYRNALHVFFTYLLQRIGNTYHIIGDGNESPSLDASRAILRSSELISYPYRAYGGFDLWYQDTPLPAVNDPIFDDLAFLCLHNISIGNFQNRFNRLNGILNAHSNIKVLFSTDGTQPRLTHSQIKILYETLNSQIGPTGFLGGLADIKIGENDTIQSLIDYWTTSVYSIGQ